MRANVSALMVMVLFSASGGSASLANEPDLQAQLDRAKRRAVNDSVSLRYKLKSGEQLSYRVEHLATVETRIQGTKQTSQSRSVSTKLWSILDGEPAGQIRFTHGIQDVDMWSQVTGREEVRYNSQKDQEPPEEYEPVAKNIGKPLAQVTMDGQGKIVDRKNHVETFDFGTGGLVVPLPEDPVKVGSTWSVPRTLRVRIEDGSIRAVSTRQHYKLRRIQTGVATISVETQILTPGIDARARSQLVQKMSRGEIKFDIDAGRVLSKELEWDEIVIGFNGPDSNMKYRARFIEKLEPKITRTAQKPE